MPFFQPPLRSKRSPLLRRAPRLARLRRQLPAHSNPNIARGNRLMRPVSGVLFVMLAGLLVRGWTSFRLDIAGQIEGAARGQTIPQLEKQLGQKIEVGRFSTDWLGRVQVEDIVVGRNAKLPTGALIQIKKAAISLDLVGLALGRSRFPDAITAVDLDSPSLYVKRDKSGKLNLASLIKSSPGGSGTRWNGRVEFQNARVFYADETVQSRKKQTLELDARGATGTVLVSSPRAKASAFDFEGRIAQTLLLDQNLGAFPLRGRAVSADKSPTRGWLETQTPFLPVALASQWARLPVDLKSGEVGGKLQLAFVGTEFAPRGDVQLRGVSFVVPRPNAAPVAVDALSGPLQFAGTAVQTSGLSARLANANWTGKGRAAFDGGEAVFDGDIGTRNLSFASARAVLGDHLLPPQQRALLSQLNAASLDLDAHASGTLQSLRAEGTLTAREATWNDGRGKSGRFSTIRATGVLARSGNAPLGFAGRFEAPNGEVRASVPRLQNVVVSAKKWSGSVRGAGRLFDVDARADDARFASDVVGQSVVPSAHLVASSSGAANEMWRGQVEIARASTQGLRLAALFPRASLVQRSGFVSGRFNFEGSLQAIEAARASGALSLSDIALSPGAIPVSARPQIARVFGAKFQPEKYLSARDLSAEVSLQNGLLNISQASAQTVGGLVSASFSTPLREFAPHYTFSSPRLNVPTDLLFDVARARGVQLSGDWTANGSLSGEGDAQKTAIRAVMSLRAARFGAQSVNSRARIEGQNADLQVAADLNSTSPRWSAQLSCDNLGAQSGILGSTGLVIPPDANGASVSGARIVATSLDSSAPGTWTMNLSATRAAVAVRALAGAPVVALRDVSALVNPQRGGVSVSRLSAKWSDSGRIDGAISLDENGVSGEILAREVEAQTLQTLLARTQTGGARVFGRLNFKAALRPGKAPQLDAQMANGTVRLLSNGRQISLPLQALSISAQTQNGVVSFQNARAVVNGASLEASGRAQLNAGRVETQVTMNGLSLESLAQLAGGPSVLPVAGLARGTMRVSFDARQNELALDGQVHLDGGSFRGVSLDQTDAHIGGNWNTSQKSGALKISNWRGELEGSPFSGNVALDTVANTWSVQLAAPRVVLATLARIKARLQNASATAATIERLAPPVAGTASAVVDLSGTLRDAKNRFVFKPGAGLARLNVPDLTWRAQHLGEVDGTFNVANGRLIFAPLTLAPPTLTGASTAGAPTISLVGSVPLDSGSGPLDARLSVGEAPLEFFVQTLQEGRDALVSANVSSPFLESVVKYGSDLPRGLQGRIAIEAQVGGSFSAPIFKVSRLALRNGRAPLPLGGLSLPATFDAAFTFANGEVAFDRAEFRLAKTEHDADGKPVAGASPPDPNSDDEDDALVQVQPDSKLSLEGNSSLVADVFNANLSQLSPWVPALRGKNGETLLRGQLESFSFRLEGPARDPKLTASLDAQNISFRGVTLARLRVARLDIGEGMAKIEPGNLSVKEGRFESSAASGSVAWSWKTGPVADGPLKLQFPFATRDFGALAALFLPGISDARADEFAGTIQIAGTVRAPQYLGDVSIKNASFQTVSSAASPLAIGIQHLSGGLRFVNGNRLEIAPDNTISGELVAPETVAIVAPTPTPAPGAAPKKKGKSKIVKSTEDNALRARGAFGLRGSIELGQTDLLQVAADIPEAVSSNIYDLRLDVSNARVDAPGTSGLQDAVLSANFVTANRADAARTQTLRWIGAGRGTAPTKKLGAGDVFSRGAIRLRSDFIQGFPSLARSTPLPWTNEASDLGDAEAAKRATDSEFLDARPQLVLKGFGAKFSGYGSAVVDGQLVLDKARAQNRAPDAARLQNIAAPLSIGAIQPPDGARLLGANSKAPSPLGSARKPLELREQDDGGDIENSDLPLRVGGNLVVSSAQIVGGGSGDGQVTRLSLLPDAPRLDVRLTLGRDVELVNSSLRAHLAGDVALSGTPANPLLLGTVQVLDGQVRFPNARVRIEDGRVSLNLSRDSETDLPRTRLEVDATARGQAGRYAITLKLHGPLQFDARDSQNPSNLRIEVTSNPSLSQDEAFQQLLGIAPRGFSNGSGGVNVGQANQAYAQAVLQLVSAPFFSGFERSVAQALGLSSVSFEYRFNEPLAFEFSKALGDRILITYRRSLGATQISDGRTPFQLRLDYRLRGDFYLGLQLDERQVKTLTLGKTWRF